MTLEEDHGVADRYVIGNGFPSLDAISKTRRYRDRYRRRSQALGYKVHNAASFVYRA